MKLKSAVDKLRKELKNDPGLYIAYQSNMAISFQDAYFFYNEKHKKKIKAQGGLRYDEIHEISNDAAKMFLTLFLK